MTFADEILNTEVRGLSNTNPEYAKIINEAILLESLDGDKDALLRVFDKVGKFASRDGLLNEDAATDIKIGSFDQEKCSDCAAILAAAKEANSPEYDLYTKAVLLMNACMDKMRQSFGVIAKEKVEEQKKELAADTRIADAVEEVKKEKAEEIAKNQ